MRLFVPFLTALSRLQQLAILGPALASPHSVRASVTPRSGHTATLLPNGKVLVAGGIGNGARPVREELYDPASGTWTTTGNLLAPRDAHTATLLPNGTVLVAAGYGNGSPTA